MQEAGAGHPQTSAPTSGGRERSQGEPSRWPLPRTGDSQHRPSGGHFGAADRAAGGRGQDGGGGRPPAPPQPLRAVDGLPRPAPGRERVKMRPSGGPSSSPPLTPAPTRDGGRGAGRPRPGAPAPPAPAGRPASHHRSSSRLSSCHLPDCTPWAPRPPPPPAPAPPPAAAAAAAGAGLAGREGGWGEAGVAVLREGRTGGRRGGGAGSARNRPAEGPRARSRGWRQRQLATLGRGRGQPNHLRGRGEVGRVHGGPQGGRRDATRERGLFSLGIRGLLLISNLQKAVPKTIVQREKKGMLSLCE